MKKLLAIITLAFLLSAQALAADSDGDGVDDAVDAFPNDPCASVDTDGDGMPDSSTACIKDGFETGNFSAYPYVVINSKWVVTSGGHTGAFAATQTGYTYAWATEYLGVTINFPAQTNLSFYYKNTGGCGSGTFRIDGVQVASMPKTSTWTIISVPISAGVHTLKWEPYYFPSCGTFLHLDDISYATFVVDTDDDNDGVPDVSDMFPLDNSQAGDVDGDGVDSLVDNCPANANADQLNTDGDAQGNACDTDDDNDGAADTSDKFPLNPAASSDSDNDGYPGSWRPTCDLTCQANSGLTLDNCPTTSNPTQANFDGDAQGDACDIDDDNDGVPDTGDAFPLDNTQAGDIDGDGVDGFIDNCPANANPDQLNTDGDTQGDACDSDDDNDGVADTSDKFPLNSAASSDSDNDGYPGSWNAACDAICQTNSGLTLDNCPTTSNPTQANTDGDAQGDACDTDDDNDGIADTYDIFPLDNTQAGDYDGDGIEGLVDNCPANANPDQLNTDGDAQGNICDSDDDNDGVSDTSDKFPLNPAASSDSDNDGYPGSWRPACDLTCQANSGLTLDNCPTTSNPTQLNTDGDAQGDACDSTPTGDADGDSIDNAIDNCLTVPNADQLDANTNGIGDACEVTTENPLRNARAGSAIAFGDFNNDGFDDVVVGIPLFDTPVLKDAGRIEIYSGANGDLLNSFNGIAAGQQFGSAIAVVADQNSDGVPDLVVGEPLFDVPATKPLKDAGRVVLYSGSDGALLQQIATGSAAGDRFGAAVAVGNGNLVVGSPWADLPLLKDAGYITVFNGLTSNILYIRSGTQTKQFFGAALAFDEVNNHLLIGSPGFDVLAPAKLTDVGQVDIFDGSSGATAALFSVNGSATGNRFGSSIASFGADIGGSADVDWAVGSPGADVVDPVTLKLRKDIGNVQVFSGLNATVQVQIDGENAGDNFGAAISASGDINNDNAPDIAIGAPGYDASAATVLKDAGTVEVFSGDAIY